VGGNIFLGYRQGLVRRAIGLAALGAATAAAFHFGNAVADLFSHQNVVTNACTFVGLGAIVLIMLEILAALHSDRLKALIEVAFDRLAGTVIGALIGVLEAALLIQVALAVAIAHPAPTTDPPTTPAWAADAATAGILSGLLVRLDPEGSGLLRMILPVDLASHLAEGVQRP